MEKDKGISPKFRFLSRLQTSGGEGDKTSATAAVSLNGQNYNSAGPVNCNFEQISALFIWVSGSFHSTQTL